MSSPAITVVRGCVVAGLGVAGIPKGARLLRPHGGSAHRCVVATPEDMGGEAPGNHCFKHNTPAFVHRPSHSNHASTARLRGSYDANYPPRPTVSCQRCRPQASMGAKGARHSMNTKGTLTKLLSTLHPNTILKPNLDSNAQPQPSAYSLPYTYTYT